MNWNKNGDETPGTNYSIQVFFSLPASLPMLQYIFNFFAVSILVFSSPPPFPSPLLAYNTSITLFAGIIIVFLIYQNKIIFINHSVCEYWVPFRIQDNNLQSKNSTRSFGKSLMLARSVALIQVPQ